MVRFLRLSRVQVLEGAFDVEALRSTQCFCADGSSELLDAFAKHGIECKPISTEGVPDGSSVVEVGSALDDLRYVVARLLGPGGCPWDQAQTHESLKRYLLEEAYEVLDAIDANSDERLKEELGDLLLQPLMHAEMKSISGSFGLEDVASGIVDKLVRRHPHVFGPLTVEDAEEVLRNWDEIKRTEKGGEPESILAGVPKGMASLLRAYEISKRAVREGFEWPSIESVFDKLREEETELRQALADGDPVEIEAEVGDLLFTMVNVARWAEVEPEEALRKMLNRFTARFMAMERSATVPLAELSPEQWDELWERAKAESL